MNAEPVPPSRRARLSRHSRSSSDYRASEFCADACRLARLGAPCDLELPEGRLRALPLRAARQALDSGEAARVFVGLHGVESGGVRFYRFRQVADFIADHESRLTEIGLARPGEPLLVREELLSFLLDYPRPEGQGLPAAALVQFLDHWGHRH